MQEVICPHCGKAFVFDEACDANSQNKPWKGEFEKEPTERPLVDKYNALVERYNVTFEMLRALRERYPMRADSLTVEQRCETSFNKVRTMAFPNASFMKDEDCFSFSESDKTGTEIVSIIFEMKNWTFGSPVEEKNEDYLEKLDKDRNKKGYEYAVLVSDLELESELYNAGIVDVSHLFPKMYVIRPKYFIPMITLLRNAAIRALNYKSELVPQE